MSDSRLHSLLDLSLDITHLSVMLSSQILGSVGLSLSVGRSCLRVLTQCGRGGSEISVLTSPVRKFPHQSLPVRDLTRGVVFVQDGHHLRQDRAELRAGDVAVLLQLRDEAHERCAGRRGAVVPDLSLELGAEQGQSHLAWPEPGQGQLGRAGDRSDSLQCGGITDQDLQLVEEVGRR